jgi:hypothetical protein
MLIGNQWPHRRPYKPSLQEWNIWNQHRAHLMRTAQAGLTVKESLAYIQHPGWQWNSDLAKTT